MRTRSIYELAFRPGGMHRFIDAKEHGSAKVVIDTPDELTRLRASLNGQPLDADKYTRLIVAGKVWMTDADFEWRTNLEAVSKLRGDILIAGLGIGFIVLPLLRRADVKTITVIENNADVIALIAPQVKHRKLKIVEADARIYEPAKKSFDSAYLDIWPDTPNTDTWPDMKALKLRYRRAVRVGGWVGAWCEDFARGKR